VASNLSATLHVNAFPGTIGAPSNEITATATGNGVQPANLSVAATTNFGTQFNGTTTPMTITFTNTGGVATTLGAAPITGANYAIMTNNCTGTLPANTGCTISVNYTPNTLTGGTETGTLSLSHNNGFSSNTATTNLTGVAQSSLRVTGSGAFGTVVMGILPSPMWMITVHNDSPDSVTVTSAPLGGAYNVSTNGCSLMNPIPGGGMCDIVVTYTPNNPGPAALVPDTAFLSVNSATGVAVATLSGNAASITNLAWDINRLCGFPAVPCTTRLFGAAVQGQLGATETFTLSNQGGQTSGALTIALSDTVNFSIQSNFCNGMMLGTPDTCTVTVRFNPGPATAPGDVTATLIANGMPGNMPMQTLQGRVNATGGVTVTPASHLFAPVTTNVDDLTQFHDFTVTNNGAGTATLNIAFTNQPTGTGSGISTQYARTLGIPNDCGATLNAGLSCFVRVYFKPQCNPIATCGTFDPSGSTVTRIMLVQATVAGNTGPYASLSGRALTRPSVAVTSTTELTGAQPNLDVDFDVNTGAANGIAQNTTKTVVLTLTNSGETATGAVTVGAITGGFANQFTITATTCAGSIPGVGGNNTCTITVRFNPTQVVADMTAQFLVSTANLVDGDPGGLLVPVTVALNGSGLNAPSLGISPSSPVNDDSIGLGGRPVGVLDPTVQTFTITNGSVASANATSGAITFGLDDTTNFKISGGTCVSGTTTLVAGDFCTIDVVFNPEAILSGPVTLSAGANPGGNVSNTMPALSRSALTSTAPGPCGTGDTCPQVDLGDATDTINNELGTMPGTAGPIQTITFQNRSSVSVGPLHSVLTGGAFFSYAGTGAGMEGDQCSGVILTPGMTCNIRLRVNSTGTTGNVNGTIQVNGAVQLPSGARPVNLVTVPLFGQVNP
jgi:hypothetical protein